MTGAIDTKYEIVRLAPLERIMRDLERVSRLGTAAFVGMALVQIVVALALLNGVDVGMDTFGHTSGPVLLQQVLLGGAIWIAVTIMMTLALNSGPRLVVAVFAAVMALFWAVQLLLSYGSAVGGYDVLGAAYEAGVWPDEISSWLGFPLGAREAVAILSLAVMLSLLISIETLWASIRGVWSALRAPAHTIKTIRGLRGLGPFSPSGLLAAFDLPLVMRERRGVLGKFVAFVAIVVATIAITFWLLAPLNVVMMMVGVAQYDCQGGDPTDVEMGACLLAEAALLGQFMLFGLVLLVAACAFAAALMAVAKRLLARRSQRETGDAPIVFLRSFSNDQVRVHVPWRGPLDVLLDLGRSPDSVDQILVYEFGRYGPVKALGKPGELRPPFGAQRIYAEHATWKAEIAEMIDGSHTSVLVVDRSEGLRWELEQTVIRPDWLARTLILLPEMEDFVRLRQAVGGGLEAPSLRRGEQVVAAALLDNVWRLFVSRRPTRFTYQTLARLHFAARQ